ncbi:Protein cornichon 4 [Dermatophagoides pteronyssinus]|uniref:Protein cornichon 4 n=2 Tax=Dermatophagoides pteronyssinus TaxID=6956 RepID=A0ABQ8J088_DERPT|nr:protein cornichon homolog 4-like [Dermatophagoides pteronyssinus]KAH9415971.1 Protein cornichon 4 [Dermatophagoides pteronyssinus]
MMAINVTLFGFALLDTGALLFLSIYILITLSDLDCDYLNPIQCCDKLNKWIIPELIAHGTNICLILLTSRWFLLAINLIMLFYLIYNFYISLPRSSMCFYDPSEIHVRGNLKTHIKISFIRMVFHLIHFFVYLYLFVISLLTES